MNPSVRKFWLWFFSINLVLIIGIFLSIKIYTAHGQSIKIPVLVGLSVEKAKSILDEMKLEVVIADSLFELNMPPGSVIHTDPSAGIEVKVGRRVYLTLNSFTPTLSRVPNLTDLSLHKASIDLKAKGFFIGQIVKRPDIAKDFVLFGEFNGRTLREGEMLPMGSTIDLYVGTGENVNEVDSTSLVYEEEY